MDDFQPFKIWPAPQFLVLLIKIPLLLFLKQQTATSKYTNSGLAIQNIFYFAMNGVGHSPLFQLHRNKSAHALSFSLSHGSRTHSCAKT
jgi:hypothetical protein